MKMELDHFYIGSSYGGNQDWFRTFMMRIGGCGAETACDSSIYFAIHMGVENIYPFDKDKLTREDYVEFAHRMEKYLWPRWSGIYTPDIYIEGYSKYLSDCGVGCISMKKFSGNEPFDRAREVLAGQIDEGSLVPTLVLNHRERSLKDYVWHWFIINGYERTSESEMRVKTVTYSGYQWFDFRTLWESGYENKGGLVLYNIER